MPNIEARPGNQAAWIHLTAEQLKAQPAFNSVISYLTQNGAPTPTFYVEMSPFDGSQIAALNFNGALRYAADVVCNPQLVLYELRKGGQASGDPNAVMPWTPPVAAYVDPRQATAPAATGPVDAGSSSSSMIYNPNLPAWQPTQPQPQQPVSVAPRLPANLSVGTAPIGGLAVTAPAPALSQDDLINMLAKAFGVSPDAVRNMLNMLKPPPPPPAVLPSVKVFDKNGAEIANGSTVTLEQVHSAKLVLSGNPGEIIAFQNWVDGGFMESNADQVVIMGGWKLGADGTLSVGIPFDGPSVVQKQATERRKFFSFPYGTADYHPLGELTLTLKFSDTLEYERSVAPLTWDPYRFPYLVKFWTAAQLGISPEYYQAVNDAVNHGVNPPPNPSFQFAPGTPQT